MTTHTEPTLDGMPEPPPAWTRPEEGVRMPALALDRMLQAALPHCSGDEDMPVLQTVHLTVSDGLLTTAATDRYTMIRERRPISQTCGDFTFLLRAEDAGCLRVLLKTVLRGLKDEERDEEPVDLALEQTDDGAPLRVLGQDLDVRFTEEQGDFPDFERLLSNILVRLDSSTRRAPLADLALNPTLLGRLVACQRAGRASSLFLFNAAPGTGRETAKPVVVTPGDDHDDLVIALMPIRTDAA